MFLYTLPHQNIFKLFRKILVYPWFAYQTPGRGAKEVPLRRFLRQTQTEQIMNTKLSGKTLCFLMKTSVNTNRNMYLGRTMPKQAFLIQ